MACPKTRSTFDDIEKALFQQRNCSTTPMQRKIAQRALLETRRHARRWRAREQLLTASARGQTQPVEKQAWGAAVFRASGTHTSDEKAFKHH